MCGGGANNEKISEQSETGPTTGVKCKSENVVSAKNFAFDIFSFFYLAPAGCLSVRALSLCFYPLSKKDEK